MQPSSLDVVEMIEAYGESSGINLTYATNLFIGTEPSIPKDCVTVFDTPGFAPYLGLTSIGYEYPSVQIRVRSTKYTTGWNLIEQIKNALHGKKQETWNGSLYTVIYCSGSPALLDKDDNGNFRFVCTFNLQRRTA
jgi:hypothetical protein